MVSRREGAVAELGQSTSLCRKSSGLGFRVKISIYICISTYIYRYIYVYIYLFSCIFVLLYFYVDGIAGLSLGRCLGMTGLFSTVLTSKRAQPQLDGILTGDAVKMPSLAEERQRRLHLREKLESPVGQSG